jgi:hypothetical protein
MKIGNSFDDPLHGDDSSAVEGYVSESLDYGLCWK